MTNLHLGSDPDRARTDYASSQNAPALQNGPNSPALQNGQNDATETQNPEDDDVQADQNASGTGSSRFADPSLNTAVSFFVFNIIE
jgi:hypothetical protein